MAARDCRGNRSAVEPKPALRRARRRRGRVVIAVPSAPRFAARGARAVATARAPSARCSNRSRYRRRGRRDRREAVAGCCGRRVRNRYGRRSRSVPLRRDAPGAPMRGRPAGTPQGADRSCESAAGYEPCTFVSHQPIAGDRTGADASSRPTLADSLIPLSIPAGPVSPGSHRLPRRRACRFERVPRNACPSRTRRRPVRLPCLS